MGTPFITKDDPWRIRETVREIWKKNLPYSLLRGSIEFAFDIFYNQYVPEAWRESKATVIRHYDEIAHLAGSSLCSQVWYKRTVPSIRGGGMEEQFTCAAVLDQNLKQLIESKKLELPTYLEIEKEKMRWQAHPHYDKTAGFSQPIEEELIQLKVTKK